MHRRTLAAAPCLATPQRLALGTRSQHGAADAHPSGRERGRVFPLAPPLPAGCGWPCHGQGLAGWRVTGWPVRGAGPLPGCRAALRRRRQAGAAGAPALRAGAWPGLAARGWHHHRRQPPRPRLARLLRPHPLAERAAAPDTCGAARQDRAWRQGSDPPMQGSGCARWPNVRRFAA